MSLTPRQHAIRDGARQAAGRIVDALVGAGVIDAHYGYGDEAAADEAADPATAPMFP